jgi:hypothetical protein
VELGLLVYNEKFNEELGLVGWDNIITAHYANIARVLDEHPGQGVYFLITYGSGYKGWFLRQFRQQEDVELLQVGTFLDATEN